MMLYAIERFNQYAVKENLSAGAILLWHHLFFTMQRKNQFADVQQHTAVLTAMLDVTRQGLQVMRQTLIDKGFLEIRQDEHQQIFYTLMLNGKVVGEKAKAVEVTPENSGNTAGQLLNVKQSSASNGRIPAQKSALVSSVPTNAAYGKCGNVGAIDHNGPLNESKSVLDFAGDIILTNRFRPYIEQFCEKFGPAMKGDLIQWAEMRRKNGWTLTLWGLEALLKNLIELSAGNGAQMSRIVAQSVKRRWKGFFELKVKPQPSGAKLVKLEEKQQKQYQKPWEKSSPMQKFKPEGRDLSFLER